MIDKCLTIDLSAVGSDIPTQLGISRPTLTMLHRDTFRATSKRTRIETNFTALRCRSVPPFRATSKRTRIETLQGGKRSVPSILLSEQHPREQGLKLRRNFVSCHFRSLLSEQHPREQGLKHGLPQFGQRFGSAFRATSKRTRIETGLQL